MMHCYEIVPGNYFVTMTVGQCDMAVNNDKFDVSCGIVAHFTYYHQMYAN